MAKKPVVKKAVAKTSTRVATRAERKMIATQEEEQEQEQESEGENNSGYQGEGDFYVSDVFLMQHQAVICFEQTHGGSVGVAIAKIIENVFPDGSFQNLIVDHNEGNIKYYSLLLAVN